MDKREDFYEPPLCPNCKSVLTVVKSKEEWGTEWDLYCEHCFYQDTNLVKG